MGIIFETVSPMETPIKMQELIAWTNQAFEAKVIHPPNYHRHFYRFISCHPPFPGWQRKAFAIVDDAFIVKRGYAYAPYSSLESVIEANKEEYYLALQRTQKGWQNKKPDWNPWLLFFFRCLQVQKQHLEVKLEKEKVLLQKLSPLNQQILDLLGSHGRLTISEIATLTKANRNTLKKALGILVKDHYVARYGIGKGTSYMSKV